jgi:TPR repeat protein
MLMRYAAALVLMVVAAGDACAPAVPATECLDAFGKRDFDAAVAPCTEAAEEGYAKAQYNLGVMYAIGSGVPENDAKAVEWYTKAAEQEHAKAQYNLGVMYDIGNGVPEDDAKAVEWYSKAAEQEHAKAQYELGTMYYYGNGVLQDRPGALVWFTRAAENGHVMSMEKLALENYMNELVACMWWNIASVHAERGRSLRYQHRRNDLEANMTAEDISEAQRMASEWLEKHKTRLDGD